MVSVFDMTIAVLFTYMFTFQTSGRLSIPGNSGVIF